VLEGIRQISARRSSGNYLRKMEFLVLLKLLHLRVCWSITGLLRLRFSPGFKILAKARHVSFKQADRTELFKSEMIEIQRETTCTATTT
jgi:hypothetical protein